MCAVFLLLRTVYIRFLVGGAGQDLHWAFLGAVWTEERDQKGQQQNEIDLAVFGKFGHRPA